MPVFYNLNATEKREVLIGVLQIVRNLDDTSLVKAWQQSIARTRLYFKLMEECLILFEVPFHNPFLKLGKIHLHQGSAIKLLNWWSMVCNKVIYHALKFCWRKFDFIYLCGCGRMIWAAAYGLLALNCITHKFI